MGMDVDQFGWTCVWYTNKSQLILVQCTIPDQRLTLGAAIICFIIQDAVIVAMSCPNSKGAAADRIPLGLVHIENILGHIFINYVLAGSAAADS